MPQKIVRGGAYVRVSEKKQEQKYSIAFQKRKIIEYFASIGVILKEEHIFIDTYTGKVWRQRKSLQRALAAAKKHEFDILVVYKMDRLSREPDDQIILREQFHYYGVKIISLDPKEMSEEDSLAGDIVRRVYAWKAKIEREDIVQRTQDGIRQRVTEGKLIAGRKALYGYQWNDEKEKAYYVIDPITSKIVIRIFTLAKDGVSLRSIAFTLTNEGIPTPDNKGFWRYQTVNFILSNPFYMGRAVAYRTKTEFIPGEGQKTAYRDEEEWIELPTGTVPALVDKETFVFVQRQLQSNKTRSPRNNPNPQETLLRCGMAVCGNCGHNLGVDRGMSRGKLRVRYRCPKAHAGYRECPKSPDISAPVLDAIVWTEAVAFMRNPKALQENLDKQKKADPTKDELATIDGILTDTANRIQNLTDTVETTPASDGRDLLMHRLDELAAKKKRFEEKRDVVMREKINWAEEQQAIEDFKLWFVEHRDTLDNPDHEPTYKEKLTALERIGIVVRVFPIDLNEPEEARKRVEIEYHPTGLRQGLGGLIVIKIIGW